MYQVIAHSLYFEGVICLVGAAHTSMIMKHTQLHQSYSVSETWSRQEAIQAWAGQFLGESNI